MDSINVHLGPEFCNIRLAPGIGYGYGWGIRKLYEYLAAFPGQGRFECCIKKSYDCRVQELPHCRILQRLNFGPA